MRIRPENTTRKIDALGRVTIPKGLRDRMGLTKMMIWNCSPWKVADVNLFAWLPRKQWKIDTNSPHHYWKN